MDEFRRAAQPALRLFPTARPRRFTHDAFSALVLVSTNHLRDPVDVEVVCSVDVLSVDAAVDDTTTTTS